MSKLGATLLLVTERKLVLVVLGDICQPCLLFFSLVFVNFLRCFSSRLQNQANTEVCEHCTESYLQQLNAYNFGIENASISHELLENPRHFFA